MKAKGVVAKIFGYLLIAVVSLAVVAFLVAVVAVSQNEKAAAKASGSTGTEDVRNLGPVKTYMDGKRPTTPTGADRVGVVVKTITKIEPWLSSNESLWHAIVYTKADNKMLKIEVWIRHDPGGISERVHVGDYVAITAEGNRRTDTSYSDHRGAISITVLKTGAVTGLPNDE